MNHCILLDNNILFCGTFILSFEKNSNRQQDIENTLLRLLQRNTLSLVKTESKVTSFKQFI